MIIRAICMKMCVFNKLPVKPRNAPVSNKQKKAENVCCCAVYPFHIYTLNMRLSSAS